MQDLQFLVSCVTLTSKGYQISASGLSSTQRIIALTELIEQNEVKPIGHPDYPAPAPWSMLQIDFQHGIWKVPRAWAFKIIGTVPFSHTAASIPYMHQENPFDKPMELRTGQIKAYDYIRHYLSDVCQTGIAQLPTAWGKSCLGIFLARFFYHLHARQQMTLESKRLFRVLIVVTTTEIGDEWRKTIAMFCSNCCLPESKPAKGKHPERKIDRQSVVALLDGKNKEHRKNPNAMFLIATVQTLARLPQSTNPEDQLSSFDLTIYDEAHHFGAELFSQVNYAAHGARILGLSATPNRVDGMEKVLEYHLGSIFYREEVTVQPSQWSLHLHTLDFDVPVKQSYVPQRQRMEETYNAKIKALSFCDTRNKYIARVLVNAVLEHPLRRIVAFSLLKAPVYVIAKYVKEMLVGHDNTMVSTYTGDDKKKGVKLQDVLLSHLILTTYSMFGEGISCDQLNGMAIITGLAGADKMEQPLGRALRKAHENIDVIVIDFNDKILAGQIHNRVRQYKNRMGEKGMTVIKWKLDPTTQLPTRK